MNKTQQKNRIEELFAGRDRSSKIMSLFLTAGYPDLESTVDLILGFEKNGAELIELGMPFSDPLADGPTIQYSSETAIKGGVTMDLIFEMLKQIREKSEIPVVLMGYINPVLRYGISRFCQKAAEAGADGLIIPDIPPEESGMIETEVQKNGLDLIYLVAPNTSDKRMESIDARSSGFVYCVSVTGVTGARDGEEVSRSVEKFIDRVNIHITRNPKMIGFGIRSYEDAERIAAKAEGFIVGSALIDIIRTNYSREDWKEKVFAFVRSLKYGKP